VSLSALVTGGALILAAYAFHWRARFLGENAHGWPAAPLLIRVVIDGAALVLLLAGLWLVVTGRLPPWLQAALALILAGYAVTFAVNISRQRGARAGLSSPDLRK
jgi:hypothetical protein